MSEEQRYACSHKFEDIEHNCTFCRWMCHQGQFVSFQNLRYGNCITFNKHRHNTTQLTVANIGQLSGLQIVIRLEHHKYACGTSTVGARVVIHKPNEIPNPEEEGFNISPGFETSVSLRATVFKRKPFPYRDECINYGIKPMMAKKRNDCIKTCIQERIFKKCGCIDQTFGVMNEKKHCDMVNASDVCCMDDVVDELEQKGPACKCPLPCHMTSYNKVPSRAVWPSQAYFAKTRSAHQLKAFRNDHAKLNVFFDKLEQTVYEQKPRFEDSEFFGTLGGGLGLWLGVSVVTLFEILEILLNFASNVLQYILHCMK